MRVRDEIKMTIAAYQSLYESSIAYGMRKALMAEQKKNEMTTNINQLRQACEDLESEVARLEQDTEDLEKKNIEEAARDEKAHKESVKYLIETNSDYKQ